MAFEKIARQLRSKHTIKIFGDAMIMIDGLIIRILTGNDFLWAIFYYIPLYHKFLLHKAKVST